MFLHLSVCLSTGGTPARSRWGEVPRPGPDGGGGTLARSRWGGIPWPGPDGGYPDQVQMGGTPARFRQGDTPGGGTLKDNQVGEPPTLDGVPLAGMGYPPAGIGHPPSTGQQMEYLICHGQYASCIHAGGLSCFLTFSLQILEEQLMSD